MSLPASDPASKPTAQNLAAGVSPNVLADLKALTNIIQSSVEQIEAAVTASSLTIPSPDSKFTLESEDSRMNPDILTAGSLITSATGQLMTLVRPAPLMVIDMMMQFQVSTAVRTVINTHVPEILRDAGSRGKHVSEIAKPTKVHPGKLARVLRLLATNHMFKEVSPDVFANNRLSSVLDTGKSIEELLQSPEAKHVGTLGVTSLVDHVLDEGFKISCYLPEALLDPEFGHAYEPNKAAFNKAFNTKEDMWTWAEFPENKTRLVRFSSAMNGLKNISPRETILEGYAWGELPEGSLVVDVGGGVGVQTLILANHHPHLRFIVQDRDAVITSTVKYFKQNKPDALESGLVKAQAQNFFEPQPDRQGDVSVFILGRVIHDWADEYCVKILKNLRAAAGPKTQLIIIEQVISHVCDEPVAQEIPGAELPVPPQPLLRNLGRAATGAYLTDLMMMSFFNGKERTVTYLRDLLKQADWKLIAVHRDKPSVIRFQKVIAVPI